MGSLNSKRCSKRGKQEIFNLLSRKPSVPVYPVVEQQQVAGVVKLMRSLSVSASFALNSSQVQCVMTLSSHFLSAPFSSDEANRELAFSLYLLLCCLSWESRGEQYAFFSLKRTVKKNPKPNPKQNCEFVGSVEEK